MSSAARSELNRGGRARLHAVLRRIEIAFGCVVLASLITTIPRTIIAGSLTVLLDGAAAFLALVRVDGAATAWSATANLARVTLAALPCVMLLASVPRRRWLWLMPGLGLLLMVTSIIALPATPTLTRWLLLVALSLLASWLVRKRWMAWAIVLPFLLLWEVVPRHGGHAADAADREQLLAECGQQEGLRPRSLSANRIAPYHGITLVQPDLVLLTGEGPNDGFMRGKADGRQVGSWWMRRTGEGFEFERPSAATGNLWRGCRLDDVFWIARNKNVVGVERRADAEGEHERLYDLRFPTADMDFTETACDPLRQHVFVGEATRGGLWEAARAGGTPVRHDLGGMMLIPRARFDGHIVVSDSAWLTVFDPATSRVVERVAAGLTTFGLDLCPTDGSAAVADMSGRLRVFTLDAQKRYQFAWGVPAFAARRVAYSPDCSRIAVTSADDRRVFIIDSTSHQTVAVLRAGPALREVTATGAREFSFAHMCSITTYQW